MRILVVSAYYPPHYIGGYELGCRDVVQQLRRRGHEVLVLTSDFRLPGCPEHEEEGVRRFLTREGSVPPPNKRLECRKFLESARELNAELIYFWSQSELCYWFAFVAQWHRFPVAFFLSDTSFIAWRIGAWLSGPAVKNSLIRTVWGRTFLVRGKPIVRHQTCHFASEFLRNCATTAGITVAPASSMVAHWGIDPKLFPAADGPRWPPRRLLYVGQLTPKKGVHTAIAALGHLMADRAFAEVTLTVAGGGMRPDYEKGLRALPAQLGIADRVVFLGKVPRADLPRIYARHDILVFPSEWEEPFAITPLEAMATGLAVVGTVTGGSGELLRDRETALTFSTGDARDCARAIGELCQDRVLWESLSRKGQSEVASHHTLDLMVDRIEASLERAAGVFHADGAIGKRFCGS